MKATPIAQYLEQKSRAGGYDWPAARRENAPPAKPKPAVLAYEQHTQASAIFRRSSLAAGAQPPRDYENEESPSNGESEAPPPRLPSIFARARPQAPAPDIEARLAEAYHRGVQEGLDSAKADAATTRALERAEVQKRVVVERLDFQMNEYAKLAEVINNGIAEMERRIADVVAQILQPLMTEAISRQIVAELAANISLLVSAGRPPLMRIRGPEGLLTALKAKIAKFAIEVEYVEDNAAIEVTVEAQHSTIRSELVRWTELLSAQLQHG